jgi:sortase A
MLIAPGYGVTHFLSSARPGAGNAVLYGHDDIDGSVFANLWQLQPGDAITVVISRVSQTYAVSDRRVVLPTAVEILAPTPDVRLTIFTCWPNNVDTRRLVITAAQVPKARPLGTDYAHSPLDPW